MSENYILHTGTPQMYDFDPHGSGRYRQGSGENPGQHDTSLRAKVEKLKAKGMSESDIAIALLGPHSTPSKLKDMLVIEKKREREINRSRALYLYEHECDHNASKVAEVMFGNKKMDTSVNKLLNDEIARRQNQYLNTAEVLKNRMKEIDSGIIDVSSDTEFLLGVSPTVKKLAIRELEDQGYIYTTIKMKMGNHDKKIKVLADPDKLLGEAANRLSEEEKQKQAWIAVQKNKYEIGSVTDFTPDGGETIIKVKPPVSLDSKRVFIRYGDEGGKDKDGVVELRRGVEDISLNGSRYSQVRIAVDGKGYIKGMAMYSDEFDTNPELKGYDLILNSNKPRGTALFAEEKGQESIYKTLKSDPDNPFGATIKLPTAGGQYNYIGKDGKEHQSPINKVSDEGDWDNWGKTWSAQFVSKQDITLINKQIKVSVLDKQAELEGIRMLTNPVIKKKLLEDFAENCDSNAANLKVRGVKDSRFQVILPISSLSNNEIYAPNLKNGEQVALIRYPHGGIFEIPVLTVNNKNKEAASVITDKARDCVGINAYNASILSGADFDGDTALVIPLTSSNTKIKYSMNRITDFDTNIYKNPPGKEPISESMKQKQMGIVTNLITDMTAQGASFHEIADVTRHSMVVIDSVKHNLDIKKSEKDHNIEKYKKIYQKHENEDGTEKYGGASTIFSRAGSKQYNPKRKEITDVNKMDEDEKKRFAAGKKVYRYTGETMQERKQIKDPSKMTPEQLELYNAGKKVYKYTGKEKVVTERVKQMYLVDDARDLVLNRDDPKEMAYANYANTLKSLANSARKEARSMKFESPSPTAKQMYKAEIEDLDRQLRIAKANNPKERQANAIMNARVSEKIRNSTEEIDYEHKQRMRAQELTKARAEIGAKKKLIDISDKQWEAIQANAISHTKLEQILNNTDQEKFKERARPKQTKALTSAQKRLIKELAKQEGVSNADIAERIGISTSMVSAIINE